MTKPGISSASERRPVIDTLAPLGWSLTQIASVLGCSVPTVRNDLKDRGGLTGAFPDRPTKTPEIYAATFYYYAQHLPGLDPRFEQQIRDLLKMQIIECTERGLISAYEVLTRPDLLRDAPLYRLLQEIDPSLVRGVDSPLLLRVYLDDVREGFEPNPLNSGQVINALKLRLATLDRSVLVSSNTETFSAMVDEMLAREDNYGMEETPLLTHREARVLRLYYGFGDDPAMTYAKIASLLEITPGRVRQINLKTIRKLRWMSENQGLLDPFRSMDDLRKERDTARAEHARIYDLHTNFETVHANLCDAVATGNLERAQRVLGIPVGQPETSNPNLSKPWDKINISARLANLLLDADVDYVWQACVKSEDWWLARKNFGRKTLNELKEILQGMRLHLGMEINVMRNHDRIEVRP